MSDFYRRLLSTIRKPFVPTQANDYAQPSVPNRLRGSVSSAGSFFGFYGPPGKGLGFQPTPYNPDSLVQKKGIKIYREMVQDEQIKAALAAKQYAVLSTGYDIQMPELDEGDDPDASEEHKRFITFNFQEMKGGIESKILGIMDAMVFGFSCSEKLFDYVDYGPFEGKWMLKDLKTRPPEDIDFQIDSKGDLDKNGVLQFGVGMPKEKFVIFSYRSAYGNLYGDSDLRAAYRSHWQKSNMLKLMAVSLERYAEPIADVSYDGLISQDMRDDVNDFLNNLQGRSGILHPNTLTVQFLAPPPRAAEAFIPSIKLYDEHMRIAVLMPGLIGLAGEQAVGSLARAVKEFDVFLWILGQLRKDLETVVNEQIVKPLIDLNYEVEHGKYPKFKFNEVTEEGRQRSFELFLTGLGAGGLQLGPEDQNKLRELINFEPLPEDFDQIDPNTGLPPGERPPPQPAFNPFGGNGFGANGASSNGNGGNGGAPPAENPEDNVEDYTEQQLIKYVDSLRSR